MEINNKKYKIVEMSQVLNLMKDGYETLREQRLFYIYLSKINARNPDNFIIRLSLEEFCKICELEIPKNPIIYAPIAKNLMQKIVSMPLLSGGIKFFPLFGISAFDKDENGDWYFEMGANLYYKDLFFNLKRYVRFRLENALRLKSLNQMRLYTLLKQYQKIGKYKLSLVELREFLGIKSEEYPQYFNFNNKVLKVCQQEINALTDMEFDYIGIRGRGRGGKIVAIEFTIRENSSIKNKEPDIIDSWTTEDCISVLPMNEPSNIRQEYNVQTIVPIQSQKLYFDGVKLVLNGEPYVYADDMLDCYAAACEYVFSENEIAAIAEFVEGFTLIHSAHIDREDAIRNNISREYKALLRDIAKNKVKNPYMYFLAILKRKLAEFEIAEAKNLNEAMKEYETV